MKPRIMYIELKTHRGGHDDSGPAWIGRVTFSDTGKTLYYRGRAFRRHRCVCGNFRDIETDDDYWISGPKKNGQDQYSWAGGRVAIDEDAREEYWTEIRKEPGRVKEKYAKP